MAAKHNSVAIGAFVVGAVLLLIMLALFVSSGGFGGNTSRAVMVFDGSVKGLKVGAPVAFKGVQIGTVTRIDLMLNTDTYEVIMPVEIQIREGTMKEFGSAETEADLDKMIERGMRGQLQMQSLLTGLLYIQVDFHPGSPINYVEIETDLQQLPTIPTDMEKLQRSLEDVDMPAIVANIESSIAALRDIATDPELKAVPGNLNRSLASVTALSDELRLQVEKASPGVNSLIANADGTLTELGEDLPQLADSMATTLATLEGALASFDAAMQGMEYSLSDESPAMYEIREAARQAARAARALRGLAETLDEQPEALIRGKSRTDN